jgi:hypothetical protein
MNGWTRSCRQCVCAPQAGRAARQATYSQHTHGAGATTTHACAMHMRIRKEIGNYCCGTHECPMTSTSASISTSPSELVFPWIGHRNRNPQHVFAGCLADGGLSLLKCSLARMRDSRSWHCLHGGGGTQLHVFHALPFYSVLQRQQYAPTCLEFRTVTIWCSIFIS